MSPKARKKLKFTVRAARDLTRMRRAIEAGNPSRAPGFMAEFLAKLHWIAEVGFSGVPRDEIAPGMRAFPWRDRCIYFKHLPDSVLIYRILHGAQNVAVQRFDTD